MQQVLHIFRNDVRHLWIEIVVSLILLALYVWKTIHGWSTPGELTSGLDILWGFVTPLVPISWCLLLARAVHDQPLIGDRQFWVTRPYEWKKLLASKVLLAVAFISVPLFIAGLILLAAAGFPPIHYIPGLLWMQLLMAAVLILPVLTASVLTSTIVQILLVVVAIVLYAIGLGSLASAIPNVGAPSAAKIPATAGLAIFFAVTIAVILIQYARRKAWTSRILVFAGAVALLIVIAAVPYGAALNSDFPLLAPGETTPVQLQLQPKTTPSSETNQLPRVLRKMPLLLPLQVSGVAQGSVVVEEGQLVTIQAPDGRRWTSHWQASEYPFWPGDARSIVRTEVDRKFFEQEQSASVNVHITFALTSYRETNSRLVVSQSGEFPIPGAGVCWLESAGQENVNFLRCRSPLKSPPFMARMDSSASTCPEPTGAAPLSGIIGYAWGGAGSWSPADLGISPIAQSRFMFQRWADQDGAGEICPGTPFTVSTPEKGKSVRMEAELDGIRLADYVPASLRQLFGQLPR